MYNLVKMIKKYEFLLFVLVKSWYNGEVRKKMRDKQ